MRIIDIEIGSKEWLEIRRNSIGASESAAVLGISPWKSPYDLWVDKMLGTSTPINYSMKRGMDREAEALEWANNHFWSRCVPLMVQHEEYQWKIATLDGIDIDNKIMVEIKWANAKVHAMAKEGKVIDYYYSQCQSQLACTGFKIMYFISCHEEFGVPEFISVMVVRDEEYIKNMIEKEKYFYEEYMVKNSEPPIGRDDYLPIEDSYQFDDLCEIFVMLSDEIKNLEQRKEKIRDKIKEIAENRNVKSNKFKFSKIEIKGSVNWDSVEHLKGVDLDLYRKESKISHRITPIS